jgi:predicted nucleic acid-binding protein
MATVIQPVAVDDKAPMLRDMKDRPVLAAAIASDVDVIITGDKDFDDWHGSRPKMLTPGAWLVFAKTLA